MQRMKELEALEGELNEKMAQRRDLMRKTAELESRKQALKSSVELTSTLAEGDQVQ